MLVWSLLKQAVSTQKLLKNQIKFTKDGIYNKVIKTSESKYAVVYVYNTDKKDLKDEIITNLASVSDMSNKNGNILFKEIQF